jgi:DNA-binding MarR family transcriptional regulator
VLAWHGGEEALSQVELAHRTGLTPMAVATMCDRLAAAGWIERRAHPADRRVNHLHIKPSARKALEQAMALADELTAATLAGLGAAERRQLLALLARTRDALLEAAAPQEAG